MLRLGDHFGRPLSSLRISLTDRCNLRCAYCMPEPDYVWLPREDLLSFAELTRLVRVMTGLGVVKVRLTGGEPLLRHDLEDLVRSLAAERRLRDLALITNGVLLGPKAAELRAAGLARVTVSLDTLSPERFARITRRADLHRVLAGIEAARQAGLPLKLNTVVARGTNEDEIASLLVYARGLGAELRFIEYMDVGGATGWKRSDVVTREEILARVADHFGFVEPLPRDVASTAQRFRLPDGTPFGIIASVTAPFCGGCDRARLTADGRLFLCLYAQQGLALLEPLRKGASDEELSRLIASAWSERADRGAEDRSRVRERSALVRVGQLRHNPHLEMHKRGG
ncbi:MAG: GTP 3',8-cyclase MoaA [Deltaproteobacteria bacterium]|nr:GTP 3',8-cyclase MoaA [Deltaproteobacteria bacterium]